MRKLTAGGKRLFDLVASGLALPVVALVGVPVAVAIKADDGGPIFYRSRRLGRGMQQFDMLKFRTMKVNAPDIRNADGSTFNSDNDSRVTRVGKFLRSTSIDELPQLWNVFKGDMSLVGPRPSPTGNVDTYPEWYFEKFTVRPGVTGLAQARYRNSANLDQRYRTDIEYVQNLSLLNDFKILLSSVDKVLRRSGINSDSAAKTSSKKSSSEDSHDESTLVMFTNFFPYHRGEEYLESEFPYLQQQFSKIVIVPVMYEKGMKRSFDTGPDTVVITSALPTGKVAKLKYTLAWLPKMLLKRQLSPLKDMRWNPAALAFDAYFTARSNQLWSQLEPKLRAELGSEKAAVYAYRMYVTAYLAGLLVDAQWSDTTRMITRAHRYDVLPEQNRLNYLPQRRFIVEHSDKLYAVSEEGADVVRTEFPEYADRVSVEHLGVAANAVEPRKLPDTARLVSVSTFNEVKRLPLVAAVVKELTDRGHDLEWVHFGAGPKPMEDKIRAEIDSLNIPQGAVRFAGYIANSDLLSWYRENDVAAFINLSSSEGVPVSIMESIAAAIPVIATDVGGTAELVHDGENGRLVAENASVTEIADAVESVLFTSDDDYARLSAGAFETWEKDWNAAKNFTTFAKKLKGFYDE